MQDEPGPLLAAGRASRVFDLGDGRVLRRRTDGASSSTEAAAMKWAAQHGVPVPQVLETAGPEIVMQRVWGGTLLDRLAREPKAAKAVGYALADLHGALDAVPALADLSPRHDPLPATGTVGLLHGDLHPGNVIDSPDGPVLLDWTNAGNGPRAADVAETWIILSCCQPPILGAWWPTISREVLAAMLEKRGTGASFWLATAAATRLRDSHLSREEGDRLRELLTGQSRPP